MKKENEALKSLLEMQCIDLEYELNRVLNECVE